MNSSRFVRKFFFIMFENMYTLLPIYYHSKNFFLVSVNVRLTSINCRLLDIAIQTIIRCYLRRLSKLVGTGPSSDYRKFE